MILHINYYDFSVSGSVWVLYNEQYLVFSMSRFISVVDGLFGSCQSILDQESSYQFNPTETLYDILKLTLEGLLELGYGWSDQYTQCIVGGLLDSYKQSVTPELYYCDQQEKIRLEEQNVE